MMLTSGTAPPSGSRLSCAQLTAPVDVPVVDDANKPALGGAEADVLALQVAAGLVGGGRLVGAGGGEVRVAVGLDRHDDQRHPDPEDQHRGEDDPALLLVLGHLAERVGEAERDGEERPDLEHVGDAVRVLVRMDRVGVEGPPPFSPTSLIASWLAIGPPVIVCSWPVTVVTVLLPWKFWIAPWLTSTSATTNAIGSSMRVHVRTRSTQKLPSVCVRRRTRPRIEGDGDGCAARGRDEVVEGEPRHLAELRHRRLARVVLPVGVGEEADRRC